MHKYIKALIAFLLLLVAAALAEKYYFSMRKKDFVAEGPEVCNPKEETNMPETFY